MRPHCGPTGGRLQWITDGACRGHLSVVFCASRMAVPRHHLAKGRQGRRRSHLARKPVGLSACGHCKKMIRPHTTCTYCGYYKGRQVVDVVGKALRKQEKARQRTAS
ncbi:MAG: 50S ribosomal protein L32 [Patescibacteria group bacterium]